MVDDWRLALDSKKVTGFIAIDLSKAFDSLCYNLLLAKLGSYGVGDDATKFLRFCLTDRKQRVKVNGGFSDWLPVQCGVPRGNLLGPLLFNIFMLAKASDAVYVRKSGCLPFYMGKAVGPRDIQMVNKTSRIGNAVRDCRVTFEQFSLIYRESATSLTIGAGPRTGRNDQMACTLQKSRFLRKFSVWETEISLPIFTPTEFSGIFFF